MLGFKKMMFGVGAGGDGGLTCIHDYSSYVTSLNPEFYYRFNEPASPANIDDGFTGTDGDAPDTNLWVRYLNPGATATIQSNQLSITSPGGSAQVDRNHVTTTNVLSGTQSIEVDFNVASDPTADFYFGISIHEQLNKPDGSELGFRAYRQKRASDSTDEYGVYMSHTNGNIYYHSRLAVTPGTNTSGKMRLRNYSTDDDYRAEYWDGSAWQLIGDVNNTGIRGRSFYASLINYDRLAQAQTTIEFDNFIASGNISTGIIKDDMENFHGKPQGTLSFQEPSLVTSDTTNKAVRSPGHLDFMTLPGYKLVGNQFTFSVLMRHYASTVNWELFNAGTAQNQHERTKLEINSGELLVQIGDSAGSIASIDTNVDFTGLEDVDELTSLIVTINDDLVKVYKNGVLEYTGTSSVPLSSDTNNGTYQSMEYSNNTSLDEMFVVFRAITDAEAYQLYDNAICTS